MSNKPRLCFISAVPMTVSSFLRGHITRLAQDYDVYVVADFSQQGTVFKDLNCISVPISRDISLFNDLKALFLLWRVFRRYQFDVIISVTPKAGLLSAIAGFLARTPCRIHWFTGQVWVTKQGMMRHLLKTLDRLIATLTTHVLADSPSQKDFLVAESVCQQTAISVIAQGSICGVDTIRFAPNYQARLNIRAQHHISQQAKVVLFLGRLNQDKGLRELAQAIPLVCQQFSDVVFLIVGPDEEHMTDLIASTAPNCNVVFQGFTHQPEQYMAAADVFCLPSYREGFGSSVLEAAACGVPAVATRIYGLTDAVIDGVTGVLVPPQQAAPLAQALIELLGDDQQRQQMGQKARERAVNDFSQQVLTSAFVEYVAQAQRTTL